MSLKKETKKSWVELGYELFSEEGHEGLQVERLSRILNKNKSGFYHYFGTLDVFFEELMKMHIENEEAIISQLITLKKFDPEVLNLILDNKRTILFQTHLVKNRNIKLFRDTYLEVYQKMEHVVIPIWSNFIGISPDVALKYWKVIRDSFHSRVISHSFTLDWLSEFAEEAKAIMSDARQVGK